VKVTSSIEINRPAAEVFELISDMSENPRWQKGQVRCTWTSDPPIGLGSTYDQEARLLGKSIRSTFEVTEYEQGERIRIVSTTGTMFIDVTRTVEPLGKDSCKVGAVVRGDATGAMRLLGPLLPRVVRSSVGKDYQRLKEILEDR